ncbi:unnamed protein product, partial [Rotaria sp. Silwood2]
TESNFREYNTSEANTLKTPYDYGSIMHYGRDYFSINGSDTLVPLKSGVTIGQRDTLSSLDIQAIRAFYGCAGSITTVTTTTTKPTTSTTKTTTTTTKSTTSTTKTTTTTTKSTTSTSQTTTTTTKPTTTTTKTTTTTTKLTTSTIETTTTTTKSTTKTTITPFVVQPGISIAATTTTIIPHTSTATTIIVTTTTILTASNTATTTTITISITSTTTETSVTTSLYDTILYFVLTSQSLQYNRIDGRSSNYYYETKEIIISVSGNYSFTSSSTFAAYCFLYANSFNPSDPFSSLVAQGHNSAGNGQFQFTIFLPFDNTTSKRKRATTKYIVVITTQDEGVTGPLSITVSGPDVIVVNGSNVTVVSMPYANGTSTPRTTVISSTKNNDNGITADERVGIIVGSVFGGLLILICLIVLCIIAYRRGVYYRKDKPFRSNKAYIYNGVPFHNDIGNAMFQTNTFTGFYFKDGIWYEPHNVILSFYPQADYIVYGKGRDSFGVYVAKGVYSPSTLRMAFDKYYETGLGNIQQNQNGKVTVQVKWNPFRQNFEGAHYLIEERHVEEQPYLMQITNPQYF